MPWIAAAAAGAAAIGGAVMNNMANMDAADRQRAAQNKALLQYLSIKIPDPRLQQLAIQKFVQTGELTPEFQQAIKQEPSEFNKIIVDQNQKSAQNRALDELSNIGTQGGLRLQDKAALQEAQMQSQIQDRGARNAILDEMNRRGQGGSGMALQAQLQGQQATGDRNARSALSVAGSAQDRALQAIMGAGDLATKYRGQNFQEQQARAQANDAINRFNSQNLQSVMGSNVAARNHANEMNLAERQRVSDSNVGAANQQQQYNKELLQKNFENQMQLANAKSGVYTGMGNADVARGEKQGNMWSNLGQGVGGAATAYGAGQAQSNAKTSAAPTGSTAQADDYYSALDEKRRRDGSTFA